MFKVAINGFGRIGRLVLRAYLSKVDYLPFEIVAINDLGRPDLLAHLLKFDSTHGTLMGNITCEGTTLKINDTSIRLLSEKDPLDLPWATLGVDLVIESTGHFTKRADANKHIEAGAKKVIISAPGKDEDTTIVMGVNERSYNPTYHHIISNASCTTNCLAPVAKVLHENFGIEQGMMTTIHSVTNDQRILDLEHSDWRRARGAFQSMIPTTTGAAKAVALVLPELKDKINGMAVRVPTPNVSMIDFVALLGKSTTKEEVNQVLLDASKKSRSILGYTDLPLVSIDFNTNSASSTVDALSTMMMGDRMVKVIAWYDNEWGYSNRVIDLTEYIVQQGI